MALLRLCFLLLSVVLSHAESGRGTELPLLEGFPGSFSLRDVRQVPSEIYGNSWALWSAPLELSFCKSVVHRLSALSLHPTDVFVVIIENTLHTNQTRHPPIVYVGDEAPATELWHLAAVPVAGNGTSIGLDGVSEAVYLTIHATTDPRVKGRHMKNCSDRGYVKYALGLRSPGAPPRRVALDQFRQTPPLSGVSSSSGAVTAVFGPTVSITPDIASNKTNSTSDTGSVHGNVTGVSNSSQDAASDAVSAGDSRVRAQGGGTPSPSPSPSPRVLPQDRPPFFYFFRVPEPRLTALETPKKKKHPHAAPDGRHAVGKKTSPSEKTQKEDGSVEGKMKKAAGEVNNQIRGRMPSPPSSVPDSVSSAVDEGKKLGGGEAEDGALHVAEEVEEEAKREAGLDRERHRVEQQVGGMSRELLEAGGEVKFVAKQTKDAAETAVKVWGSGSVRGGRNLLPSRAGGGVEKGGAEREEEAEFEDAAPLALPRSDQVLLIDALGPLSQPFCLSLAPARFTPDNDPWHTFDSCWLEKGKYRAQCSGIDSEEASGVNAPEGVACRVSDVSLPSLLDGRIAAVRLVTTVEMPGNGGIADAIAASANVSFPSNAPLLRKSLILESPSAGLWLLGITPVVPPQTEHGGGASHQGRRRNLWGMDRPKKSLSNETSLADGGGFNETAAVSENTTRPSVPVPPPVRNDSVLFAIRSVPCESDVPDLVSSSFSSAGREGEEEESSRLSDESNEPKFSRSNSTDEEDVDAGGEEESGGAMSERQEAPGASAAPASTLQKRTHDSRSLRMMAGESGRLLSPLSSSGHCPALDGPCGVPVPVLNVSDDGPALPIKDFRIPLDGTPAQAFLDLFTPDVSRSNVTLRMHISGKFGQKGKSAPTPKSPSVREAVERRRVAGEEDWEMEGSERERKRRLFGSSPSSTSSPPASSSRLGDLRAKMDAFKVKVEVAVRRGGLVYATAGCLKLSTQRKGDSASSPVVRHGRLPGLPMNVSGSDLVNMRAGTENGGGDAGPALEARVADFQETFVLKSREVPARGGRVSGQREDGGNSGVEFVLEAAANLGPLAGWYPGLFGVSIRVIELEADVDFREEEMPTLTVGVDVALVSACPQACSGRGSCTVDLIEVTDPLIVGGDRYYSGGEQSFLAAVAQPKCDCEFGWGGSDCSSQTLGVIARLLYVVCLAFSNLACVPVAWWCVESKRYFKAGVFLTTGVVSAVYHLCDMGAACAFPWIYLFLADFIFSFFTLVMVIIDICKFPKSTHRGMLAVYLTLTLSLVTFAPTSFNTILLLIGSALLLLTIRIVQWTVKAFVAIRTRLQARGAEVDFAADERLYGDQPSDEDEDAASEREDRLAATVAGIAAAVPYGTITPSHSGEDLGGGHGLGTSGGQVGGRGRGRLLETNFECSFADADAFSEVSAPAASLRGGHGLPVTRQGAHGGPYEERETQSATAQSSRAQTIETFIGPPGAVDPDGEGEDLTEIPCTGNGSRWMSEVEERESQMGPSASTIASSADPSLPYQVGIPGGGRGASGSVQSSWGGSNSGFENLSPNESPPPPRTVWGRSWQGPRLFFLILYGALREMQSRLCPRVGLFGQGLLCFLIGASVYLGLETDENYWWTHGVWHLTIFLSPLLLLRGATRGKRLRSRGGGAWDSSGQFGGIDSRALADDTADWGDGLDVEAAHYRATVAAVEDQMREEERGGGRNGSPTGPAGVVVARGGGGSRREASKGQPGGELEMTAVRLSTFLDGQQKKNEKQGGQKGKGRNSLRERLGDGNEAVSDGDGGGLSPLPPSNSQSPGASCIQSPVAASYGDGGTGTDDGGVEKDSVRAQMLPGPPSPSGKKGGKRGSKKKGRKKKGERGGGMYEYLPMNNERGPVSSPSPTSSGDPPLETMTPESRAENGQADPSASPSDSGQVEVSEAAPNSLSETTGFQGLSGAFGHEMANSAEEDEDEEDAIAFRSPNLPANIAISSADPAEDDEASPSVFQSAQGRVTPGEGDGNSSARRLRAPQTPVSEKGGGSLVNAGASQSLGLLDDFRSAHSEEDREGEQMDDEWRSQVSETASAGLLAPPSPQNGAKTKETDMQNGDLALE